MKQKTKPNFGLLFVLTMALGMVLMMPTKALAAETITTLTLTGLTKPVAGEHRKGRFYHYHTEYLLPEYPCDRKPYC